MANMEELSQHPSWNVSSVDIDQFHAAEKGEFVFARHFLFKKAPDYAPKYSILSKKLQKLFERAFIDGAKILPLDQNLWNFMTHLQNT